MDTRKVILLVGALLIAGVTAFMARSLMMGASAPVAEAVTAPVPGGPEVLVATRALAVGTILDATSMKFQPWPKELVENAYFMKEGTDLAALQGTVVRTPITAGQPITQGVLVKPGDRGFLAAALGPGMRAVTVPVSNTAAVAGFVFPGDRVDVVLTQSVEGGGDGPPLKASETVIRNLRVLATDQRTDNVVGEDGKTQVSSFSNVTLEVTPRLAEKVAVAQTLGTLSLSLRSIADNSAELDAAIAAGDIKVPDTDDPKAERQMMADLASRPIDSGRTTFATGGDVSRFQRASIPGRQAQPVVMPAAPTGPAPAQPFPGASVPQGPVVRITRGNNVSEISVGSK